MQNKQNDEQLNQNINPITELESLIKDPKCTQDLTQETNDEIEKLENIGINEFNYQDSIEKLLLIEKKCRQVSDSNSSCKIIHKIITWLLKYSNIEDLLLNIQKICKKRGQLKKVISFIIRIFLNIINKSIVNLNSNFIEYNKFRNQDQLDDNYSINYNIKDLDECLKIINNLNEITQGKIYLELERARLMLILSSIKQEQNNLKEASLILEEVSVETIGNMELKEKTQYVLEQMRISLLCKDFVRLQIFAKKINPKVIQQFPNLKIIYYQYLIILWHIEQNPKEISQCFLNILDSIIDNIEKDDYNIIDKIPEYMKYPINLYGFCENNITINTCIQGFIIYLILDSYSFNIKNDLLLFKEKYCKYIERNIPYCIKFLNDYLNQELLFLESTKTFNYTIPDYFTHLSNCFIFNNNNNNNNNIQNDYQFYKDKYYTEYKRCKINLCNSKDRFLLFLYRIQERNLVIISKYYKTISFMRIQDLLNLDDQELQIVINDLVEKKIFSAKINQPNKKISFINNSNDNLFDKFHNNIGIVLNKLDLLSDLISNDMMIHQFKNDIK